jgi:hypothetical protein
MRRALFNLVLLFSITPIYADVIESGAYIIGSVGYGYVGNNTYQLPSNNHSYTLGLTAGYAFNRYVAIDGGATFMPNNNGYGVFSNYVLTSAAARVSLPIGDFFSAYLHAGPGALLNTTAGTAQAGAFLGMGGIFKINGSLGINIEDYGIWLPSNVGNDINIFAVGLVYAF